MWACEKFDKYLCGLDEFRLETNHKPLVPLINNRSLVNVPLRCRCLLMRLMRYKPVAEYVLEKTLLIADALSRSPQAYTKEVTDAHIEVECYVATVIQGIPASPSRMESIKMATAAVSELQSVIQLVRRGWPEHSGNVLIIPQSLRADILKKIHHGHQGLTKCRDRANSSVWWPGLSAELKHTVMSCYTCQEQKQAQQKEPLISTPLPNHPWKRIALDLCEHNKTNYLVI